MPPKPEYTPEQTKKLDKLIELAKAHGIEGVRGIKDLLINRNALNDLQVTFTNSDHHIIYSYIFRDGKKDFTHIGEVNWIHASYDDESVDCKLCENKDNIK